MYNFIRALDLKNVPITKDNAKHEQVMTNTICFSFIIPRENRLTYNKQKRISKWSQSGLMAGFHKKVTLFWGYEVTFTWSIGLENLVSWIDSTKKSLYFEVTGWLLLESLDWKNLVSWIDSTKKSLHFEVTGWLLLTSWIEKIWSRERIPRRSQFISRLRRDFCLNHWIEPKNSNFFHVNWESWKKKILNCKVDCSWCVSSYCTGRRCPDHRHIHPRIRRQCRRIRQEILRRDNRIERRLWLRRGWCRCRHQILRTHHGIEKVHKTGVRIGRGLRHPTRTGITGRTTAHTEPVHHTATEGSHRRRSRRGHWTTSPVTGISGRVQRGQRDGLLLLGGGIAQPVPAAGHVEVGRGQTGTAPAGVRRLAGAEHRDERGIGDGGQTGTGTPATAIAAVTGERHGGRLLSEGRRGGWAIWSRSLNQRCGGWSIWRRRLGESSRRWAVWSRSGN